MSCNRPTCQSDLGKLAEEAERLQTLVNEFIGRATMADVELPRPLYDTNAALLLVPGQLREMARQSAEHEMPQVGASRSAASGRRW
jgi:hypothetical protein